MNTSIWAWQEKKTCVSVSVYTRISIYMWQRGMACCCYVLLLQIAILANVQTVTPIEMDRFFSLPSPCLTLLIFVQRCSFRKTDDNGCVAPGTNFTKKNITWRIMCMYICIFIWDRIQQQHQEQTKKICKDKMQISFLAFVDVVVLHFVVSFIYI